MIWRLPSIGSDVRMLSLENITGCDPDMLHVIDQGWWNENMPPKKDDGSHYVRGCKKCHCTNPELPTTPGCVPYSFLVLPTITQIVKAANHLGLLLDHKKNDSAVNLRPS